MSLIAEKIEILKDPYNNAKLHYKLIEALYCFVLMKQNSNNNRNLYPGKSRIYGSAYNDK